MDNIKHKSLLQMLLSVPIAGVLVGIDQLTKYWANTSLRVNGPVSVINGVFSLTWTQNDGAAWGMLGGNVILNWLPIIIALSEDSGIKAHAAVKYHSNYAVCRSYRQPH